MRLISQEERRTVHCPSETPRSKSLMPAMSRRAEMAAGQLEEASTAFALSGRSTWEGLSLPSAHEASISQSCLTLCNHLVCSSPGSSVLGIFQVRILEWGAIPFSTESPQPSLLHCRWIIRHVSHQGSPSGKCRTYGRLRCCMDKREGQHMKKDLSPLSQ